MKSLATSILLLSLGLFCPGCQQESGKKEVSETVSKTGPTTATPGEEAAKNQAAEVQAAAAKTEPKKANEGPAKVDDRPEVERLIANLKDNDWLVRRDAAQDLGKLGDKRAVEPLIAGLKDEDPRVRFNAAEALGKLDDKRAVDPLIACLKDKQVDRAYAAEALGKLGDKRAVEPLIECLNEKEVDCSYAAEALGKLGDKRAVDPLIECLKDNDVRARRQAAEALGKLGDKRAAEPLVAALPDWPVKDTIGAVLKQLDFRPATDQERFYCRVAQRDGKGLLEDWQQSRQRILDDAGSQDTKKVQSAVYTVIALGKEDMVDDLVRLLNSCENQAIAEIYLNCRHKGFNKAAENWAARRGFHVPGGTGGSGPAWGSW